MHILEIRPAPPGVGKTVAYFDIQLTDDCRLQGLKLVVGGGGQFVTHAPNIHGVKAATFTREFQQMITRAAAQAWSEYNDGHKHAA